ncbi:MAG: sugar phosphate isomerase/epimerase [Verrucomicrobia bacterium]|nr:sugar phosphate isomerase/epimerase [Verrucomicrobiota bacterium]MCF7708627.1 sugar phosphate isomerase/epimerase [Verrucomicrobiota bacterium]
MKVNRRDFISLSAVAGAMTAIPATAKGIELPDPKQKAKLRLSCQEGVAPGGSLNEKLDFLEEHGFTGIEPHGGGLPGRVDEYKKALRGRDIKVSAVCAGFSGVIISEKESSRKEAMRSIKEILTASGEIGAVGMIVVPAFNGQTALHHKESRELLLELLPELGDHAQKAGTSVLLEPLNRREAYFLRQLAPAASICRDANNKGVRMMGDFWHMTWEETSDMGAFISGGEHLKHVHIASRKSRKMPGEDEGDNYVEGFRGLKVLGYQNYVSFECGSKGDRRKSIPAAAKLLREQWAQA